MKSIIQYFPMETATLSQTVDALEHDDIIVRRIPCKNKRQTYLSLTPKGLFLKKIRDYFLHIINLSRKEIGNEESRMQFLNAFQNRIQK